MPQKRENKKRKAVNHHSLQNHSFRAAVYETRKITKSKKLQVKLSPTKKRTKTLSYVDKMVELNQHIKFVFADVNGDMKLRFDEP